MIYLDNSATTRMHPEVIEMMTDAMNRVFANPSSLHKLGGKAERLVNMSRQVLARSLQVSTKELVFTSGGTEANNLAIQGTAYAYKQRGRHLITTQIEHASVFEAFKQLENNGWEITYLPVDTQGKVNPQDIIQAIRDDTVLVSVMHVNNETGSIQPIQQIGKLLQAYPKTLFHVDAVQSFGKLPLNLQEIKIDMLSLSAHKFHGPKGVGALYVRDGVRLTPLSVGGDQERSLRAGTLNVHGIAGLAKAVVLADEMKTQQSQSLIVWKKAFIDKIQHEIPQVKVNGDLSASGSSPFVVSLSFAGLKSEVIVHALEAEDCYVSSKSACSSKLEKPSRALLAMGLTVQEALGTIRVSMGLDTKESDLQQLAELLIYVIPSLQQLTKV